MKKWVFFSGGLLMVWGIFFMYSDTQLPSTTDQTGMYVNQNTTTSVGYEHGRPVFRIDIQQIKQKSYKHILIARQIQHGTIYNAEGATVISNLRGNRGRINTHTKSIIVTGNIHATVHPVHSKKIIQMQSRQFFYRHRQREAKFKEGVQLMVNKVTLQSDESRYVNQHEHIHFTQPTRISDDHSTTTIDRGLLAIRTSELWASTNIKSTYKKKISPTYSNTINALLKNKTVVRSQQLTINFRHNDQVMATYNTDVRVSQPGKKLQATTLALDFITNTYSATGNVQFNFDSLDWVHLKKTAIKNKRIAAMLKKPTKIMTDYATFNTTNNQLLLQRNVTIKQRDFKLTCDSFIFDFTANKMTASGNVTVVKFGIPYLNTPYLSIDITNETFKTRSSTQLSELMIEI
jgi:lipopolysaccharide export system protein LptA